MGLRTFCSVVAIVTMGCAARSSLLPADVPTHTLTIRWQRLVDPSGRTCPRCASTEDEVTKAVAHLRQSLGPAGIAVAVEAERMGEAEFLAAPLESNRIWINGRPLEDWLGARTESSACSGCCGDNTQCRTVAISGRTYEAIPAALIVRAGILAAGRVLQEEPPSRASGMLMGSGGNR